MYARNWSVKFAVSLYVLFFAIAFWSVLPSSVTGSVGWTSSLVEAQVAACGLQDSAEAGQSVAASRERKQKAFSAETYTGWISPTNETVYQCALQAGALFN